MFQNIVLRFKNNMILSFLPIIVYYVVLPFYSEITRHGVLQDLPLFIAFTEGVFFFVPFISLWWGFIYLKEVIEEDGREILLLNGGISITLLVYYLLNLLLLSPVFLFFSDENGQVMGLFLKMVVIIFFMYGLLYFLSVYLKNMAIVLLLVLMYSVFSSTYIEKFERLQYYSLKDMEWGVQGGVFLLVGIILWIFAHRDSCTI